MHKQTNETDVIRLIPVTQWPQYHTWPSVSGLRWLVFNSADNGFDVCIRRVGRRVLIDEKSFFNWVDQKNSV